MVYARDWFHRTIYSSFRVEGSGFILINQDDLELHKEMLSRDNSLVDGVSYVGSGDAYSTISERDTTCSEGCFETLIERDRLVMLGEEHKANMLVRRLDFWLYYCLYFFGGTIGLVYTNNLGQIAQSLGLSSTTSTLITIYSAFSFFGRLLSAAPDIIRT